VNGTGWRAATLLDSGLVMSVRDGSTELYNPYSDSWRSLMGPLFFGRTHGTVTRLSSGKVLLAGGRDNTRSTLLFDPATESWSTMGDLAEGRAWHTATLLDSGQVLVTGGDYNLRGQRQSAELYEPATGTWSSAQPLPEALSSHAATLLYSGRVLVTGGYHLSIWSHPAAQARSAAYVFDPATRAWTPAGHMSRARMGHVSIRLYSGSVLVAGNTQDNGDTSSDVYDPYNNQWLPGPSLPIPGPYVSATMLYSGEVLVLNTAGQGALYDPAANAWQLAASAHQVRGYSLATLLHTGQVLAIGEGAVERYTY
jgi:N-acetylneuraminic acid mutarotase